MQLLWLPLLLLAAKQAPAAPLAESSSPSPSTSPPPLSSKLIVSSAQEPQPMMYQFITEYWPTTLGENHYIKPGVLVGSYSVDSGALHVRQDDEAAKRPISMKQNILYVALDKMQPVQ